MYVGVSNILLTNYYYRYRDCNCYGCYCVGFALNQERPEGDGAVMLIEDFTEKLKDHQVSQGCFALFHYTMISLLVFIYTMHTMHKHLNVYFISDVCIATTTYRKRECVFCGRMCWAPLRWPPALQTRYYYCSSTVYLYCSVTSTNCCIDLVAVLWCAGEWLHCSTLYGTWQDAHCDRLHRDAVDKPSRAGHRRPLASSRTQADQCRCCRDYQY